MLAGWGRGYATLSYRWSSCINYLKFFHKWDCLFPLICSFTYLFASVWADGYRFYNLGYNLVLLDIFCCSSSSNFGHWELFQLAHVPPGHMPFNDGFLLLNTVLLTGTTRCSWVILCISCTRPRISRLCKVPSIGEWCQNPGSGCWACSLLLGTLLLNPLRWWGKGIYVCVPPVVSTRIYKCLCM